MAEHSRIVKVAGLSFIGFCAVSAVAAKMPLSINTVQVAGFCGAFLGGVIGRYRRSRHSIADPSAEHVASLADASESQPSTNEELSDSSVTVRQDS